MKSLIRVTTLAALTLMMGVSGCSSPEPTPPSKVDHDHAIHHHEAAAAELVVEADPAPQVGRAVTLRMMVHRPDGSMVTRFAEHHDAPMHLILVREGLDGFDHVHPMLGPDGLFTTRYTFELAGRYLLFADCQPQGDSPMVAQTTIEVAGNTTPSKSLTPDTPGEVTAAGLTAEIAISPTGPGGDQVISIFLADAANRPVTDLEPYMGSYGHLVIIAADGEKYIHAHPDDRYTRPGEQAFITFLDRPGVYKGWFQCRRDDSVKVIPFVFDYAGPITPKEAG